MVLVFFLWKVFWVRANIHESWLLTLIASWEVGTMSHLLCAKLHSQFPFVTRAHQLSWIFKNYPAESLFMLICSQDLKISQARSCRKCLSGRQCGGHCLGLEILHVFTTEETPCMHILPIPRWPWLFFYCAAHKILKVPINDLWQKGFAKYKKDFWDSVQVIP